MATSVPNLKLFNHARSLSLPSSSHPLLASVEQHLDRLRSSEGASSSSHTPVCQRLAGLKSLYECLDDVLQLPLSQQALSHERNGKLEEEVLDGSLRLLDICGTVRDIYSQTKDIVQEVESSLRRKRCGELARNEIDTYIASRKKLNKMICKCYKDLKKAEKNFTLAVTSKEFELVNLIREVPEVSFTMLESTLSFISGPKAVSQPRGWSLISRLLQTKRASCDEESDIAGIEKIEFELHLLKNKKPTHEKDLQMQNLLKRLKALDLDIQELAEMLEVVFRFLLKTRVSLLNILNR